MSKAEMDEGFFSREEHEMAHRDVFGNFIDRPRPPRAYEEAVAQAAASVDKAYERQFEVTSEEQRPRSAHQTALDAYWAASTPAEEAGALTMLQAVEAAGEWDPNATPPGNAMEQALDDLEELDPQTMGIAPSTQTFYVPPGGIGSMGPNMEEYNGATPHRPTWDEENDMIAEFLQQPQAKPRLSAEERKATPICSGVLDYFPLAIAEVARVSKVGNDQHNPGEPLHWARGKSGDHADCVARHLIERGGLDTDGMRHTAKVAWRALALLQEELEDAQ